MNSGAPLDVGTTRQLFIDDAVLDEEQIQRDGFGRPDCARFDGDSVRHEVTWRRESFSSLKGRMVRLKFYLRNARLYSFAQGT